MPIHLNDELCNFLCVRATKDHESYLGLPSLIRKNKKAIFSFIKDKAWHRMQGWRRKLLSKAGKEVLLKTIVQAIPSYVMSVFLIPLNLCAELERMMNSFWWGTNKMNHRGIH